MLAGGKDPIEERKADRAARAALAAVMTFEQAAGKVHDDLKPGWKNPKHGDQWINTLRDYAFPKIGKRKVDELAPGDFAEVLRPIWLEKPETASRVNQRCHTVMKWCRAQGLVKGNPLDVVDHLLPQQPGKRERTTRQPSMPWRDIPAFAKRWLHTGPSNVTRALLEFVILTAARSGEARAMTWAEVDLEAKVWTVPANRMKAKVTHRVPLSVRASKSSRRSGRFILTLIWCSPPAGRRTQRHGADDVPARSEGAQQRTGRTATAHGFRSSFRDWASENGYARDLAERALAHTISNQAEAAYHRTDLLEQRRAMMEAWAQHVQGRRVVEGRASERA